MREVKGGPCQSSSLITHHSSLLIQQLPALFARPRRAAFQLAADRACRLIAIRTDELHVADVEGSRLLDPPRLLPSCRLEAARLLVAGDQIGVLDDHPLDPRQRLQYPASLPAVFPSKDQDRVALPHVHLERARLVPL